MPRNLIFALCFYMLSVSMGFAKDKKVLRILTRNAPTTYFLDRDGGPTGMDYDIGMKMAADLGLKAEFVIKETLGDLLYSLENGEGDFAMAGITKTKKRNERFLFSRNYQSIRQQLVCRPGIIIKSLKGLSRVSILVPRDTSYVETLKNLKKENPKIKYKESLEEDTEDILRLVYEKKVDCTIADSNIITAHQLDFPSLKVQRSFKYEGVRVVFPKQKKMLRGMINDLINRYLKDGTLVKIEDKYYGHTKNFDIYDFKVFHKRIDTRLKKYLKYFKKAGTKYDIDWRLLAAISYQESHWRAKAKSPTGVRGMMMLTRATAKEVKVRNRLDPVESIFGGAIYFRKLINRMPGHIPMPDRLWMAIASYNVGYYHMRDARGLAIFQDKNPNLWKDVKTVLPLLSKRRFYRYLPYGYARGNEPVIYVKRIRNYYDFLKKKYQN